MESHEFSYYAIYYNRCSKCRIVFTTAFDDWSHRDFAEFIYNDSYVDFDPEYLRSRPNHLAQKFMHKARKILGRMRHLDYGGGTGTLSEILKKNDIGHSETYDPFNSSFDKFPKSLFNVVTCYECLEHVPNPMPVIKAIDSLLSEDGFVHVNTGVVENNASDREIMNWWYLAPRNGHVAIFSKFAVELAWAQVGFMVEFLGPHDFVAYRSRPEWAREFLDPEPLPEDFNRDGYLAWNPDVKASGMDPELHFHEFGRFENRKWR